MDNTETCVACGSEIPEGRQVCPRCVAGAVIDKINNSLTVRDFNSNDIAIGYYWAISDIRKLLLEFKKEYLESEGNQ